VSDLDVLSQLTSADHMRMYVVILWIAFTFVVCFIGTMPGMSWPYKAMVMVPLHRRSAQ